MIIAEIPKAYYCSVFCFLQTTDVYLINVWGYTKILPNPDSGIWDIFCLQNPESEGLESRIQVPLTKNRNPVPGIRNKPFFM